MDITDKLTPLLIFFAGFVFGIRVAYAWLVEMPTNRYAHPVLAKIDELLSQKKVKKITIKRRVKNG